MGGAVVKGWHAYTRHETKLLECIEKLRESPMATDVVIQKLDLMARYLSIVIAPAARTLHMKVVHDNDGVRAVIAILRLHSSEIVLRSALRVMGILATDANCGDIMREENVKTLLFKYVDDFPDDEYIINDIQKIMKRLKASVTKLGINYILNSRTKTKSLTEIFMAMKNQPKQSNVQQEALNALWELCKDTKTALNVLDIEESIPLILMALKNHRLNSKIQQKGFGVLCVLAKSDAGVSSLIGRSGAIALVSKNLKCAQEADQHVFQQALWVLNVLGKLEKNFERIQQERIGLVARRYARILQEQSNEKSLFIVPLMIKRLMRESEEGKEEEDLLFDGNLIEEKTVKEEEEPKDSLAEIEELIGEKKEIARQEELRRQKEAGELAGEPKKTVKKKNLFHH